MSNGTLFPVTSNFVVPKHPGAIQGSYVDLPLMRMAVKFVLELRTKSASYASLSEIEIYAGGNSAVQR